MSTMTDLHDFETKARSQTLLGHVVLYSVKDTRVAHGDLARILKAHGLGGFIPRRPADVDVFRRVCSGAQRKRVATADADIYTNILVRDVTRGDSERIAKRIVIETVNTLGEKLGYVEAYDVSFDRKASQLSVRRIGAGASVAAADEVAQTIVREVPAQLGVLDGNAVRSVINRALDGTNAVSVRDGGGAYFCGLEHTAVVEGLEALAVEIVGTTVNSIPLPDVPKQRAMLRQSVEFEAAEEIERTMTEVRDLLKGDASVSVDKVTGYMARYKGLKDKAASYSTLLETNLGSTTAALDVLARQIKTLNRKAS